MRLLIKYFWILKLQYDPTLNSSEVFSKYEYKSEKISLFCANTITDRIKKKYNKYVCCIPPDFFEMEIYIKNNEFPNVHIFLIA